MAKKPMRVEPLVGVPTFVSRCPKCQKMTLTLDSSSGKILCTSCGFSENLRM